MRSTACCAIRSARAGGAAITTSADGARWDPAACQDHGADCRRPCPDHGAAAVVEAKVAAGVPAGAWAVAERAAGAPAAGFSAIRAISHQGLPLDRRKLYGAK